MMKRFILDLLCVVLWTFLKALRKQDRDVFRWELYEYRMAFVESSMKAEWLSLKALRKQDGFRWKLYENQMAFVEISMKAGWLSLKALRKQDQDVFRWELYENRMAFVESSTNAEWPSLKALRKQDQDDFRSKLCESRSKNRENTKFCDKIAYVGGPFFRRRPWPFHLPPWVNVL